MKSCLQIACLAVLLVPTAVAANELPIAVDDAYETTSDGTISVDSPGVLENDTDADDDPLTAVLDQPPHPDSEFDLFVDGAFEYKPPEGFVGVDTFTYVANDGTGDSNVATVVIDVLPGTSRQLFTDEVAFLATVDALGFDTLREGFEKEAAWGHVRSTIPDGNHTAPSVMNRGVTWTSNNPTSEVTTSEGAARRGQWGYYSLPHGDFATGIDCHLPGNCSDGWIAATSEPIFAAGGWVSTNTPFAKLELILDGDAANPLDFNVIVDTQKRFFGVVDPAGFHAVEFHEREGKAEDQKFIFGDDFTFAFGPSGPPLLELTGSCPGEVTIAVSGATADARVEILSSRAEGSATVTSGPCTGVLLGLDRYRRLAQVRTDANGGGSIVRNTNPPQCGLFVQALDTRSCIPSAVGILP